ncbi:MAG TPA: methyltransferase domain-containing protein, partial [Rhodothermales bacterium]|nr:methyltransferase domain-containing protein [Rhodothermales bacterium]
LLALARRKFEPARLRNVDFTQADAASSLPFPDAHFDVAMLVTVLGEVEDATACLRAVYRVLRPGGVLAVHEHVPDPDRIAFAELCAWADASGFVFARRWGPDWNYTACFHRPGDPQDASKHRR